MAATPQSVLKRKPLSDISQVAKSEVILKVFNCNHNSEQRNWESKKLKRFKTQEQDWNKTNRQ